jgi:hypothetical protein
MPSRSPVKKRWPRLFVELLEPRLVLNGPTVTIPLDPTLDQFGDQILTVQAYSNPSNAAFSIFDSGASAVTFSADDQAVFASLGSAIPIKVPGGATADGIGGTITGDVSQPGTIIADGMHASTLTFDSQGFPIFGINFTSSSGTTPGIQAFVGTDTGSPLMPTITGTPILEPSPTNPAGLAAEVYMQGEQLNFSDVIPGLIIPVPDLYFVAPKTQLTAAPGTIGPLRIPMAFYGDDNYLSPGSQITSSPNLVQPNTQLVDNGITLTKQTFLFDTGAQLSIISTAEAHALGLDLAHPTTSIDVQGVGGDLTIPGFTLDQLDVPLSGGGVLQFTHAPVYVLDIGFGIDGLLGMNLLNNANALLFNPYDPAGPAVDLTFNTSTGGGTGGDGSGLSAANSVALSQLGLPFLNSIDGGHNIPGLQLPAVGGGGGDAPLASTADNFVATEGQAFDGPVATFTDADPTGKASDYTATITWGDGQSSAGTITANSHGGFNVTASHTYAEEGGYTFTVKIKDSGGSITSTTGTAGVVDAPLNATAAPLAAIEGLLAGGKVASFTDTNPAGDLADFSATINWGDGQASAGVIAANGHGGFDVSSNHTYAEEGSFTITVTIQDVGGSSVTVSGTATVADALLQARAINIAANEGANFSGKLANFFDVDPNGVIGDYSATIAWGDGTTSSGSISADVNGGFDVSGSHVYAEEGFYSYTLTIADAGGSSTVTAGTATIIDPSIMPGSVPPLTMHQGIPPGSVVVATFQDPGGPEPVGNYSAVINWGDGSSTTGTISQPGGSGTPFDVNGSHTYSVAGKFNVTVTITEADGDSAATGTMVQVFQPPGIIAMAGQTGQWWGGPSDGSSQFAISLWDSWNPAVHWANVQTADFTRSGRTDIVGFDPASGAWWVGVSNGTTFTTTLWTVWNPHVTWVDVRVADFDGDGKADIVGRVQQTGQWWMAQSTGSSFVNSLWETWSPYANWSQVLVGDFSGDGKADIAGYENGHWWVGVSTGSSFRTGLWANWNPNVTWVDVQAGDFSGDGKTDIAGRVLQTGDWWVGVSTGSSFTASLWGNWNPAVTWVDVRVGDFNGDGKADIIGRVLQTGQWWEGQSTGSAFTNSLWAVWSTKVTWVDVQVGDFNNDGKDDIAGLTLETGQWWTSLSGGSSSSSTSLWASWAASINWIDAQTGILA